MPTGFHISDLKGNVESYARPYLFNVYIEETPSGVNLGGNDKAVYLVKSASLPTGTIEPIEISYQGQTFKIGGAHTFDAWSCTYNVDMNADIRKQLLEWQRQVHDPDSNVHGMPSNYYGTVKIEQLDVNGDPILTYLLHQAWPSEIAEVSLDYSEKSAVAEFSVTWTYNWYTTE